MAENSLAPGFVLIYYTSNGHQHKQTLPVKPAFNGVGNYWETANRLDAYAEWTSRVDGYVPFLQNFLSTTATVDFAELWTQDAVTGVRQYRDSHAIGEAGVDPDAPTAFSQFVMTFRTEAGGILRTYILEPAAIGLNIINTPPYTGLTAIQNWAGYFQGNDCMVMGRDGSFPIASIRAMSKTNDALRKKYLL